MTRARLKLVAAGTGFFLILVELAFAVYSTAWFLGLPRNREVTSTTLDYPRLAALIPPALLLVSFVLGGLVLYRVTRGQSRWSWHVATLAPIVALRAAYHPQLGVYGLRLRESGLPWANVPAAYHSALVYGLQIGLYLAVAAYLVAIALSLPTRLSGRTVPVRSDEPWPSRPQRDC